MSDQACNLSWWLLALLLTSRATSWISVSKNNTYISKRSCCSPNSLISSSPSSWSNSTGEDQQSQPPSAAILMLTKAAHVLAIQSNPRFGMSPHPHNHLEIRHVSEVKDDLTAVSLQLQSNLQGTLKGYQPSPLSCFKHHHKLKLENQL